MVDELPRGFYSHDNLCTHCTYKWPESVGISCAVMRGKRPRALVKRCGQYDQNADEKMRLRELAECDAR